MFQTFEAVTDEQGNICLVEPIRLPAGQRVLVTILDGPIISVPETALLSEPALAEDWNRPEEDEAWSHLQFEASLSQAGHQDSRGNSTDQSCAVTYSRI